MVPKIAGPVLGAGFFRINFAAFWVGAIVETLDQPWLRDTVLI